MEHCTCVLPNPIDLLTFIISRPENEELGGVGEIEIRLSWPT